MYFECKNCIVFFVNLYMVDHRALANVGLTQACQINDILKNSCIAKLDKCTHLLSIVNSVCIYGVCTYISGLHCCTSFC